MAVASCAYMYVKAARVAAWKGGGVELRHWGMKWNGELRLGSDRGMRAGCWSTGIGEEVDGLIVDVSVTPTSRESEVMVVVVVVVVSLGRGSSVVGTGLQDDAACDHVVGGILYEDLRWRGTSNWQGRCCSESAAFGTTSAQLSMFSMEKRYRNKIIIIT